MVFTPESVSSSSIMHDIYIYKRICHRELFRIRRQFFCHADEYFQEIGKLIKTRVYIYIYIYIIDDFILWLNYDAR